MAFTRYRARSASTSSRSHRLSASQVLAASFFAGAVPFSGITARALEGVDLRSSGSGTVSGSGLYEVAGFAPMAVAGSLEVAVGAVGPLLAGRDRPVLAAAAGGLAIAGHNWSPYLSGAGGRGISTVLGTTLVLAPEGTVVVGLGLGGGKLARRTGLGCFLGLVALFPVLVRTRGIRGFLLAMCLVTPVLTKRILGNSPAPLPPSLRTFVNRLLFDNDCWGGQSPETHR